MSVETVERLLDQAYLRWPIPHPNSGLSTWYCLTASEDMQRNFFVGMAAPLPSAQLVFYIDKYKYSMRYALQRIARESTDGSWAPVPRKVLPKHYIAASKLMVAGVDYSSVAQLCSALHAKTAFAVETSDSWRLTVDFEHHDKSYVALEFFGIGKNEETDPATRLFTWISAPALAPDVVRRIAGSVHSERELLFYTFRGVLAKELARYYPRAPRIIPESWRFPWGSQADTSELLAALGLRCLYHVVAIHFGAAAEGVRGGGPSNLLLVISHDELVANLERLSGVSKNTARDFVSRLTLGNRTQSPDPALQPIVPLGAKMLAIPCIHFLSSHAERNVLSLMARTETVQFNSQSSLFEKGMVGRLAATASVPANCAMLVNRTFRGGGTEEEIDVLLIDEGSHHILVCELRWILPPGDPKEVRNRKSECLKKVRQVRRKVDWIANNSDAIAQRALGPGPVAAGSCLWTVSGVVLIEGYGGTRSPDARFPIMPIGLFTRGLNIAASLASVTQWISGMSWLPIEQQHFGSSDVEVDIGTEKPLIVEGLSSIVPLDVYLADALKSLHKRSESFGGAVEKIGVPE
ncbi:nuclease-related domain-containing protein [Paraburkholderia sp. IMGN_8]|uniref:nuclease-related domain-containing protein n=1 Tax=Paraburkholderia sp. IMGN_8 TaxID=3136564 RepID=UPI003101B20D